MSALLNRPFVKMNGLGNEILVIDARREPIAVTPAAARAIAASRAAISTSGRCSSHGRRPPAPTPS